MLLHDCALGERSSGYIWKVRASSFKCYVDHSHTMYSSGNIDVRNWVYLFESPCILGVLWWWFPVRHMALQPCHQLPVHCTCRKLHMWFNSTQPSVLPGFLFVVCCSSSAVMMVPAALQVASPCHLMFSNSKVNAQCRLYNVTTGRDD